MKLSNFSEYETSRSDKCCKILSLHHINEINQRQEPNGVRFMIVNGGMEKFHIYSGCVAGFIIRINNWEENKFLITKCKKLYSIKGKKTTELLAIVLFTPTDTDNRSVGGNPRIFRNPTC